MKEQSITVFTSFFMLSWWFYECWVYKLFVDRVIERQSNIRTFLWRVFECIGQQMRTNNSLTCPLVNLSTRNFVTQKNFVHLLLCLSIILSFLASNSFTCKFVTQKNFVHLLLCLSIILSFLASNSFTCKFVTQKNFVPMLLCLSIILSSTNNLFPH